MKSLSSQWLWSASVLGHGPPLLSYNLSRRLFIEVAKVRGYFVRSECLSCLGNTPQIDRIHIERIRGIKLRTMVSYAPVKKWLGRRKV